MEINGEKLIHSHMFEVATSFTPRGALQTHVFVVKAADPDSPAFLVDSGLPRQSFRKSYSRSEVTGPGKLGKGIEAIMETH